jgi:hypothetical protein
MGIVHEERFIGMQHRIRRLMIVMLVWGGISTWAQGTPPSDDAPTTAETSLLAELDLAEGVSVTQIARGFQNPRGVAILEDGRLMVVEAGIGDDEPGNAIGTGSVSRLTDVNGDGDFDDQGEREALVTSAPSYNSLQVFRTGHDEPFGLSDIFVLDDGRIFYNQDDPFAEPANPGEEGFYGDVGVFQIIEGLPEQSVKFLERSATLNGLVYDPLRRRFYVVESGYNRMIDVTMDGEARVVIEFDDLPNGQQLVPSGIAFDPTTGDILIAGLSGYIKAYYPEVYNYSGISYNPGDAVILRFDPTIERLTTAITGLTTAIDVQVDEDGNIYTLELTQGWPPALMPYEYDLYGEQRVPDVGGYNRFAGRLMMHPADGSDPVILVDGLDTPTHLTYHEGALYVSVGLGTPNREVYTPYGVRAIEGAILRVEGFRE